MLAHLVKSNPSLIFFARSLMMEHGSARRRKNHPTYNPRGWILISAYCQKSGCRMSHVKRTAGLQRVMVRTSSAVTSVRITDPDVSIYFMLTGLISRLSL